MWIYGGTPQLDEISQWRQITAISISFTVLMVLVVALRVWVRARTFQAEDGIIIFSAALSIIYNAFAIAQTRLGLGLPLLLRPKSQAARLTLLNYAGRPFYLVGIAGFKLALCISYLKLLDRTRNNTYRWIIITVATISTSAHIAFVFQQLFNCTPVGKSLDPTIPGTCLTFGPANYALSGITIACDVVIFLLPIPLIARLHLDRTVKIALCGIFSLGLLTTICSILRMAQIPRIATGDGNSSLLVMFGALELNVGIIVSCLPVLRPLLRHLPSRIGKVLSGQSKQTTKGQDGRSSRKISERFSSAVKSGGDRSTDKDDGESEEIMLENTGGMYDTSRQDHFSIMKTVDYKVEEQPMSRGKDHRSEAWNMTGPPARHDRDFDRL